METDFAVLNEIWALWKDIDKDPKLDKFVEVLSKDPILKKNKLIVFTESKETGEYLEEKLKKRLTSSILSFSSLSSEDVRHVVISNFDAKARTKKMIIEY